MWYDGQQQLNHHFLSEINADDIDNTKITALKGVFVDSKVILIYGAAGTGKTTLMNYLSNMMDGRSKLFLAKTHTALENLQRRIKSPGYSSEFIGIDKFIKSNSSINYDVIFIDEYSTIDNRTMVQFLEKINGYRSHFYLNASAILCCLLLNMCFIKAQGRPYIAALVARE